MASKDDPAAACPVDHKTREAWLKQAKAQSPDNAPPSPHAPHAPLQASGCDSSQLNQSTSTPASSSSILSSLRLATDREVSSIPRALPGVNTAGNESTKPANNEKDTGHDEKSGNWIYPSEKMFFDAMKRKSYDPQETDMRTIVPIHNAVNERAWHEIKQWEKGRGADA